MRTIQTWARHLLCEVFDIKEEISLFCNKTIEHLIAHNAEDIITDNNNNKECFILPNISREMLENIHTVRAKLSAK